VYRQHAADQGWLNRLGEACSIRETPDGYPPSSASWSGPGQMMVVSNRAGADWLGLGACSARMDRMRSIGRPSRDSECGSTFNGLRQTWGLHARRARSGHLPQDWNTLFLSSPEFMAKPSRIAP